MEETTGALSDAKRPLLPSVDSLFDDLHAASDTQRGTAEAVFVLMKFIDFDGLMKDCVSYLKSSPDPAKFTDCVRRVRESLESEKPLKISTLNFMLSSLIDIGGGCGDLQGLDGCIKMLYWRTQLPIGLESYIRPRLWYAVHPKGFVNFSDPFIQFIYMVLCDRETLARTNRYLSWEVRVLDQQLQAAEDRIELIADRCKRNEDTFESIQEALESNLVTLKNEIFSYHVEEIGRIEKLAQQTQSIVADDVVYIKQIGDEISADHGRGENPAVGQGDPRPAARGDFWKPLITAAGTLASILGLYVASVIWEEEIPYSGLFMAAMILFLYATLYFIPTVKQYGILRRRISTCRPELRGPLKFQMLTIDIKTISVAALTSTVLYHSLLMYECYDERHVKPLLPS